MSTCLIIDDEPLARSLIREYLESFPEIEILQECNDGFEGIKALNQHKPDLIFLDIQMPKINGFEMLELYEEPVSVIFSTAFDQYAMKAFENNAIDYLLKPYSKERFDKAVHKWLQSRPVSQPNFPAHEDVYPEAVMNRIVVRNQHEIKILPLNTIYFFEAYGDYIKIHTNEGMFLKKMTMTLLENKLPASAFVRIHRSYIVNITEIHKIEPMEKEQYIAILKNHRERLSISRRGYGNLKEVLGI